MQYINSEGEFNGVVVKPNDGWIGESDNKETPFIRVPVKVTDEGPEHGNMLVWQGWLSNDAFENTIKRLREAFNFNGDLAALVTGRQTFADLPCIITTEEDTYFTDKKRFKIKWLNAPGGGGKPMDQRKLDALLARLTPQAIKVAKMAGNGATAAPAPATEPADSDVPF